MSLTIPGWAFSQLQCKQSEQVVLDDGCTAVLQPAGFLVTTPANTAGLQAEILTSSGMPTGSNVATQAMINSLWQVRITDAYSGQSCVVPQVSFVDTTPPVIICPSQEIVVYCNYDLTAIPPPVATDNCGTVSMEMVNETVTDSDICDDGAMKVARLWRAYDDSGNASETCTQSISMQRSTIIFPKDIVWSYDQYVFDSTIIAAEPVHDYIFDLDIYDDQDDIDVDPGLADQIVQASGSGYPKGAESVTCGFDITYEDSVAADCGGIQVYRKWTVAEQCSGTTFSHTQKITVLGQHGFEIDLSSSPGYTLEDGGYAYHLQTQNINGTCLGVGFIPYPVFYDAPPASISVWTVAGPLENTTPAGGDLPGGGLAPGTYSGGMVLFVQDSCGNKKTLKLDLIVEDSQPPQMICPPKLTTSFQSSVSALTPESLVGPITDNCCVATTQIRRLQSSCAGFESDQQWGDSIRICCADAGDIIPVRVRAEDCHGNVVTCAIDLQVTGSAAPQCAPLPPVTVTCLDFTPDLSQYGTMSFTVACGALDSVAYSENWDAYDESCHTGTITRTWLIWDTEGNSTACLQKIFVEPPVSYTVQFPDDVHDGALDTVAPVVTGSCGPIGWTVTDTKQMTDSCQAVIMRHYLTHDSCDYQPGYLNTVVPNPADSDAGVIAVANQTNHGVFDYTQLIYITDDDIPVVYCDSAVQKVCNDPGGCTGTVALQLQASDSFVPGQYLDVTYVMQLDTDDDGQFDMVVTSEQATAAKPMLTGNGHNLDIQMTIPDVPRGVHEIIWSVSDPCGHTALAKQVFEVVDCEAPQIHCKDLLDVSLTYDQNGDGIYMLTPQALLQTVADNCSGTQELAYFISSTGSDADADTVLQLDCSTTGSIMPTVYVQDAAGNETQCQLKIYVQDTLHFCNRKTVNGTVLTYSGHPVPQVTVTALPADAGLPAYVTHTNTHGQYELSLPQGHGYAIQLSKADQTYPDGVDMSDVQRLVAHILAAPYFTSPYQSLAANVLAQDQADQLEAVEIRRLVLGKIDHFAKVPVWGFTAAGVQFPDILEPFGTDYGWQPISLLTHDQTMDFVGFKYGDINDSAYDGPYNNAKGVAARSRTSCMVVADDEALIPGRMYSLRLCSPELTSGAYQLSLRFDPEILSFEGFERASAEWMENAVNLTQVSEGLIAVADLVTSDNKSGWFAIRFKARRYGRLSDAIRVTNSPVKSRCFDDSRQEMTLDLQFRRPHHALTHVQSRPNPFSTLVTVEFGLTHDQDVELSVYSASGVLLATRSKHYPAGLHREIFEADLFSENGVYYYRVKTGDEVMVKKMIRQQIRP